MICPRRGCDTAAMGGRCGACSAVVSMDVATTVLTPIPEGARDSAEKRPPGDPGTQTPQRPLGEVGRVLGTAAYAADKDATLQQDPGARPAAGIGPPGVGQWFGTRYHVIKLETVELITVGGGGGSARLRFSRRRKNPPAGNAIKSQVPRFLFSASISSSSLPGI